jgi:hypothetical protein
MTTNAGGLELVTLCGRGVKLGDRVDHDAGLPGSLERGRKKIRSWTKGRRRVYFPPVLTPNPRPIFFFERKPRHSTFHLRQIPDRGAKSPSQVLTPSTSDTPAELLGERERTDHHQKSPGHRPPQLLTFPLHQPPPASEESTAIQLSPTTASLFQRSRAVRQIPSILIPNTPIPSQWLLRRRPTCR